MYKRVLTGEPTVVTIIAHDAKATHQRPPPEGERVLAVRGRREGTTTTTKAGCERLGSPQGNQPPHWTVGGIAH